MNPGETDHHNRQSRDRLLRNELTKALHVIGCIAILVFIGLALSVLEMSLGIIKSAFSMIANILIIILLIKLAVRCFLILTTMWENWSTNIATTTSEVTQLLDDIIYEARRSVNISFTSRNLNPESE